MNQKTSIPYNILYFLLKRNEKSYSPIRKITFYSNQKKYNINWIIIFKKGIPLLLIFLIFLILNAINSFNVAIIKGRKIFYDKNNHKIKLNNINNFSKPQKNKNIYNNTCKIDSFLINEKLFWKNQTSLNIEEIKKEINNYKEMQISFERKTNFIYTNNPKVSLVITVHNQDKYINMIYRSIQKQELKDIEIIFVDDASKDNTSAIIKKIMEYDKRIIYLKNDKKRRAFYSRNKGILKAKGEYILVMDPDDLLINNILIKAYKTAKQFNLDIVQFYALRGYFESPILWKELKNKGGILKNNEEIRNNFYYCISRNLWDKLIRKNIYIKSIHFMNKQFYNQLYYINNDDTAFFGLMHVAKTYGFLEQIGYFYIMRPKGSYYYRIDPRNMNLIFMSIFNNMKYFFIQSDNNTLEKRNLAYKYFEAGMNGYGYFLKYVTEGIDYFLNILDLYLNSSYFNGIQKQKLNYFKSKFIERKKNLIKKIY